MGLSVSSRPLEVEEPSLGSLLAPDRLEGWVWVMAYTAVMTMLSLLRYRLWIATGFDLGLYEQGLWLILHHGILAASSFTGAPILARGASYILLLLSPLYGLFGLGFLLAIQAFALGTGYLFLQRIGYLAGLTRGTSRLLGVAYLAFPTVVGTNLFDFHPDTLGIPILFGIIVLMLEERWVGYGILSLLAFLVKDTMVVVLFGLGLTLVIRRRPLAGLLTMAGAVVGVYVDVFVLAHGLLHGNLSQWTASYANLGPSPQAGIRGLVTHPWRLFLWVRDPRAWEYLVIMLAPLGAGIVLAGRRLFSPWWIPALMVLEIDLLSKDPALTDPFHEASLFAVPALFTAVAWGMGRSGNRPGAAPLKRAWMGLALVFLLVTAYQVHRTDWHPVANVTALSAAAKLVPARVPVVTQNFIEPHLSNRRRVWLPSQALGRTLPRGTYVLLVPDHRTGMTRAATLARLEAQLSGPRVQRIMDPAGGIGMYRILRPLKIRASKGGTP